MRKFIKIGQVAKILDISSDYVWTLAKTDKIPAYRIAVLKNGKTRWGFDETEIRTLRDQTIAQKMEKLQQKKVRQLDAISRAMAKLNERVERINKEV